MNNTLQSIRTFAKYLFYSKWYKNKYISPYPYKKKEFTKVIHNKARVCEEFKPIIWSYWEGDALPYIVQKCIGRIKSFNPSFKVVLLNPETIHEYLPDFSIGDSEMPLANKSDLIRLELLYEYGGIWMDATIILNESLEWLLPIMQEGIYDCVGFLRETSTIDLNYPVIESYFLCSPPHNPFIKSWLYELRPLAELGAKSYFQKIRERSDYKKILQNIDLPEYLVVYLAQQIVMQEKADFNVCLQSAEKTVFYYQEKLAWNFKRINFEFMLMSSQSEIPIIKLIKHNASDVDYCYKNSFINKNSIIGKVICDRKSQL